MLKTISTAEDIHLAAATWRRHNMSIGFVPTIGHLHEGHRELVKLSQKLTAQTIVSIFPDPRLFGPDEDKEAYSNHLEEDRRFLESINCDYLYTPIAEEIYSPDFCTKVDPGPMANVLEGTYRPDHFVNLATVVTKLLLQIRPDYAFFGEKDYQQLLIVKRIVHDLSIPVNIISLPILREEDGLPFSSRNAFLSPEEREKAAKLPEILFAVADRLRANENIGTTLEEGRKLLTDSGFKLDYLELADGTTLELLRTPKENARLLVAVRMGNTRLIDNVALFETEEEGSKELLPQ